MARMVTYVFTLTLRFFAASSGIFNIHSLSNRQPWIILASMAVLHTLHGALNLLGDTSGNSMKSYEGQGLLTLFEKEDNYSKLKNFEFFLGDEQWSDKFPGFRLSRVL